MSFSPNKLAHVLQDVSISNDFDYTTDENKVSNPVWLRSVFRGFELFDKMSITRITRLHLQDLKGSSSS